MIAFNERYGIGSDLEFAEKAAAKTQSVATAVIAVNAIANIPHLRPAESMLERAMAPSDEEFEEDPEGVTALWGGICDRAYSAYRPRGPKK